MTSSVMSRTWSPPLVRSCVSCWKTFTVRSPSSVVDGRGSACSAYFEGQSNVWKGEPNELVAGAAARRRVLGRGPARRAASDRDRALHTQVLVTVDRTVDLIGPGLRDRHLEGAARAGRDVHAVLVEPIAFDGEGVVGGAVIDAFEDVGPRLRERDVARVELVLGLVHRHGLDHRSARARGGRARRTGCVGRGVRPARASAACGGAGQDHNDGTKRGKPFALHRGFLRTSAPTGFLAGQAQVDASFGPQPDTRFRRL